jgi:hypothetical protein
MELTWLGKMVGTPMILCVSNPTLKMYEKESMPEADMQVYGEVGMSVTFANFNCQFLTLRRPVW